MRYHQVLLPALASLAIASDNTTDSSRQAPDALPLEDLRDIPVPTYTTASGTSQDIPYATSAAIAEVSSQVAATPLSVFPAATNVPVNAASTTDSSSDSGSSNVIVHTGSKLKRDPSGVARQPRKRDACSPQPTIANYYNVNLDSAASFKADSTIASVASGAKTPSGYYQNFKNLGAANSAMNYLGYGVVETGSYDVDFCAQKCDAKAGCLSFNIYFERDPTLDPADGCPNPQAFANIKCSFWGTGLDAITANNPGQWRTGSNAYTSYKLGGPVDGWLGPQDLGSNALNAPLWDCTNTWTYLGYKLLQAGSIDPRLCAAACDAQTEFNKQHPAGANAVPCNAFGSYILNKKNSTGSYQQGQMCTFYTAYWDEQYATNTGGYDGAIGATYTFTYSAFYGKQGTQPQCGSGFTTSSGTYINGGDAQQGQTNEAKKDITPNSLQPFCSSLLGYTTPTATATATTTESTSTTFKVTATTSSITVATSTSLVTTTVSQNQKRQASGSASIISINTADYPNHLLPTGDATISKRDVASTPGVLARYPATILSSACSQAVPSPTNTVTTTTTTTISQTSTITTTVYTETDVVTLSTTILSTVTTTAGPPQQTCGTTSNVPTVFTGTNVCDSKYAGSCGVFVPSTSGDCFYDTGTQNSYGACAGQCDYFVNCYAFNHNQNNANSCFLCVSSQGTIDGSNPGASTGKRTSCPASPGCFA